MPILLIMPVYDNNFEQIQQAKNIIDADISRHFSIEDIARQVALGKTKLKQGFREYYGKGLYTYLRETRMAKAVQLVTGTNIPFKQVAKACGFKYSNNFIAAYTKFYHSTPGTARKNSEAAH